MTTRDQQIAAAVIDLDALQALAEAATPGPWDYDTERNDGEYGAGPDCSSGFESFCIIDERGQTLFDSLNSDAACVQEECDEDHFRAWDEVGERNAKFIAAANPAAILSLIDRLRKAEAAQAHHLSEQDIAILVYRHTGINARQFPDEYAEQRKLVKATVEACMDAAPDSEGAKG